LTSRQPGELSDDRRFVWNGVQWVSAISPDGSRRWDGSRWVATGRGMLPASGLGPGLTSAAPPPLWRRYVDRDVAMSLGCAIFALFAAQIVSPLSFPVLVLFIAPVVGLWRGFHAQQHGMAIGGAASVILNLLGGAALLVASGWLESLRS
jgi:hypothetical protein